MFLIAENINRFSILAFWKKNPSFLYVFSEYMLRLIFSFHFILTINLEKSFFKEIVIFIHTLSQMVGALSGYFLIRYV